MPIAFRAVSYFLLLLGAVVPSLSSASVFGKEDLAELSDANKSIQSLKEDVSLSLRSMPGADVARIQSFAYLEVTLEAAQERLNSISIQTLLSESMDSQTDEFRVLNVMYEETLQKSIDYLSAKRSSIIVVATAQSSDRLFVGYCDRAARLLGDSIVPSLDKQLQILQQIHR